MKYYDNQQYKKNVYNTTITRSGPSLVKISAKDDRVKSRVLRRRNPCPVTMEKGKIES